MRRDDGRSVVKDLNTAPISRTASPFGVFIRGGGCVTPAKPRRGAGAVSIRCSVPAERGSSLSVRTSLESQQCRSTRHLSPRRGGSTGRVITTASRKHRLRRMPAHRKNAWKRRWSWASAVQRRSLVATSSRPFGPCSGRAEQPTRGGRLIHPSLDRSRGSREGLASNPRGCKECASWNAFSSRC